MQTNKWVRIRTGFKPWTASQLVIHIACLMIQPVESL